MMKEVLEKWPCPRIPEGYSLKQVEERERASALMRSFGAWLRARI
jgi:hypothetical protein